MLDRVGDEHFLPRNARFLEGLIKDASGGTDEWLAGNVFLVARLLAHEHQMGVTPAFARHWLGRIFIKRAATAFVLGAGQFPQGGDCGRSIKVECKLPYSHWRSL
jgi:hypothetical protein